MSLSPLFDAVCPVFWIPEGHNCPEQIGSAVLLRMDADVFLLTAAHVTDFSELGTLLIPGEGHLMSIAGYFSHIPIRSGATREDDKGDIA